MKSHGSLDVESEGTGISRPLSENVNLLGALLGQAITERAGAATLDLVEELRHLCKDAAANDDDSLRQQAADRIAALDDSAIAWVLRAYDAFFHLVNQAEKQEIQRINRERSRAGGRPRPESIDDAIGRLKAQGRTFEEVTALFARLDVQPTFTAHPTEARRRSILDKQRRIAELLGEIRDPLATADEVADAQETLYDQIALLLATDEIRAERPTVQDEVEQGLYFLLGAVWDVAPVIHRDVERALQRHYDADAEAAVAYEIPLFLQWRSWIGSDRDGNPNVTADVTRWALDLHRTSVMRRYVTELNALRDELSISEQQVATPRALEAALAAHAELADEEAQYRHEPYRRLITRMIAAITTQSDAYNAAAFRADLEVMRESLTESGFETVARNGLLARIRVLARTFGFHLVAMDVRQHSNVHEAAVAALLAQAGVCADYAALPEEEKLALLDRELRNPRPLVTGDKVPEDARATLDSFHVIREAIAREPASIGCYIVSMTKSVSDLLEPMLIAKEAGVWRIHDGAVECSIDFVPLFETIEDLADAGSRMTALFTHDTYKLQVAARRNFQEIMLGYSDSNKDGGYWMANWALHLAQAELGEVCAEHDVDFRLFHGRGGSVGRGGGRANLAITAMPDVVHNGRIRVTEQGEVISFRYALKDLAHRHTEQLVNATLLALARAEYGASDKSETVDREMLNGIAGASMEAYRTLIDDPTFWDWFIRVTPIEQISRLPITSRPASRSGGKVEFASLRAIPWVFSWTQTRYLVPGWYGIGSALTDALGDPETEAALQRYYRDIPFFRVLVDNAQREMSRARIPIAARYAALVPDDTEHHQRVATELESTEAALARVTGRKDLHDFTDIIQKSIALRNPYTDVLNLLQIELLKRSRSATPERAESLRQLLFLSINGIAAAMQSTG